MSQSQDEKNLKELFDIVCDTLKNQLQKTYYDKDGNETGPPANTINVARQLLKDNEIGAKPTEDNSLGALEKSLPFDDQPVSTSHKQ